MEFIRDAMRDLRCGIRILLKRPSYSLTVLLTLALTIGALATMYSIVDQVVFEPLPVPDSDELISIELRNTETHATEGVESISFDLFERWTDAKPNDLDLAWVVIESSVLTEGDVGVYSAGHFVSHNFLAMIGVEPMLGREFTEEDAGQPVLAISYDMWQQDLGADPDIVGRTISLDKNPYTVVAVMPDGYLQWLEPRIRYWRPIDDYSRGGGVIGRLPPNSTRAYEQQLDNLLNRSLQEDSTDLAVTFVPMLEELVGPMRPNLLLLAGSVSTLLLVALLNLTNMTYAHFHRRIHELTTRASLGATRLRLVRQLIAENVILAAFAAALAIFMARSLLSISLAFLPDVIPRRSDITSDSGAWAFILAVATVSGILVTLIPGIRIVKGAQIIEHVKQGGNRSISPLGSNRLQRNLIAAQVSLALLLLVATGLLLRSYDALLDQSVGFDAEDVVTGHIWRPDGLSSEEASLAFERVLEEIESLPEVSLAAAGSTIPMGPFPTRVDPSVPYSYPGQPTLRDGSESRASMRTVTDDFFRVLGIPLVAGRFFDGRESTSENPTLIVNRAMAEAVWPDGGAIGRELTLQRADGDTTYTIVGVIENYKFEGLSTRPKPEVFLSMSQQVFGGASYVAKIRSGDAESAMLTITNVASRLDRSMPMIEVHTMSDLVADSLDTQRTVLGVILGFALSATLLAGVGIYGLTSFLIGCKTREIGIRMALGCSQPGILGWVARSALLPVAVGALAGLVLTVPLAQVFESLLFGVEAWDWQARVGALFIILLVAGLAPVGPALRAASIRPNQALRDS